MAPPAQSARPHATNKANRFPPALPRITPAIPLALTRPSTLKRSHLSPREEPTTLPASAAVALSEGRPESNDDAKEDDVGGKVVTPSALGVEQMESADKLTVNPETTSPKVPASESSTQSGSTGTCTFIFLLAWRDGIDSCHKLLQVRGASLYRATSLHVWNVGIVG
jgi:hypothetical protein